MKKFSAMFAVFVSTLCVSSAGLYANAPIIVGDGTAASCTEDALYSAMTVAEVSGGRILFDCGREPVTIPLVARIQDPTFGLVALRFSNSMTIDGGGTITLKSPSPGATFAVSPEANVAL